MPFPRLRLFGSADSSRAERRRMSRARQQNPNEDLQKPPNAPVDRKQQRVGFGVGVFLILVGFGITVFG